MDDGELEAVHARRQRRPEVLASELDAARDAVHGRVVRRQLQAVRRDVRGDDPPAGARELRGSEREGFTLSA